MTLPHPELVRLDLPARYTYLHLVSDCIADLLKLVSGLNDSEMLVYNIQLAAHEACTNIINHAYGNRLGGRINITLTLDVSKLCLTIDLQDNGQPFDQDSYNAPNLEEVRVHGYGLFLIRHLMDNVTYTQNSGHNHWCLTKNLFLEGI